MSNGELKNIIMIEDDQDIRTVAKLALETVGGLSVKTFASGREALDDASDLSPDLILLDVMMPEMDGPTTLSKLREISHLQATPVLFMTAKVQAHEVEQYKALGALDVITKPFDPMTLAEQIKNIWGRYNGSA